MHANERLILADDSTSSVELLCQLLVKLLEHLDAVVNVELVVPDMLELERCCSTRCVLSSLEGQGDKGMWPPRNRPFRMYRHAFSKLFLDQGIVKDRPREQSLGRRYNLPGKLGSQDCFLEGAGRCIPISNQDVLVAGLL